MKDNINSSRRTRDQLVPYQWPWTDEFGRKLSLGQVLWTRKFSIAFLAITWGIVSILGFASTRNCDTWQLAFACDRAIWMIELKTAPWEFIKSWYTAPFFHNGLDHLLFVTIFGMLMPVQSFEVQYGSKATIYIFLITYTFIGLFNGLFFNWGIAMWPDVEFFQFGFERSWMGGSVGFYGVIGALSFLGKKKWLMILLVICFEMINHFGLGIAIHISFIHMLSSIIGFVSGWLMWKYRVIY